MSRSAWIFLIVAFAIVVAIGAVVLPIGGAAAGPLDPGPTATARSDDARAKPVIPDAADPTPPPIRERRPVASGMGALEVFVRFGIGKPPRFVLRAEPLDGGSAYPLETVSGPDDDVATATLPAGQYRLEVVRGAGDSALATRSAIWTVDPPGDLVIVTAAETTRHTAVIVERADAPARGVATIQGMAWIDGRPAADLVVRTDVASGSRTANVGADGSFRLDDAPAGMCRVELCSRLLRSMSGDSVILIYGSVEVAPLAGAIAEVTIHAETCALSGGIVPREKGPGVQIGIAGAAVVVGPLAKARADRPQLALSVAADGTFDHPGLPPGAYRVEASSKSMAAAPVLVQIDPGAKSLSIEIALAEREPVRGRVLVDRFPHDRAPGGWLSIRFTGPSRDEVTAHDGEFGTMLIPGRYEVEFLGRGWGYGTAEPIEVVAGQTAEFELIPVRRRR